MEIKIRIGALIIEGKRLLLVKGKEHEELWTPGGKIEKCESDRECLQRELKEEINVNLISMEFFGEYFCESPYYKNRMTRNRIYIVKIEGDLNPGMEIEKIVWYTKEDFYNKRYPMIPVNEEEIIPDIIKRNLLFA